MKTKLLVIALTLSLLFSAYLYYSTHSTVVRWQARATDNTLVWVTRNPHFIALKLWLELTYNLCAVTIFLYSGIQLLRRKG